MVFNNESSMFVFRKKVVYVWKIMMYVVCSMGYLKKSMEYVPAKKSMEYKQVRSVPKLGVWQLTSFAR